MKPAPSHPCATACAYGTCAVEHPGCGGCCRCMGGCVVDWEDTMAAATWHTDATTPGWVRP